MMPRESSSWTPDGLTQNSGMPMDWDDIRQLFEGMWGSALHGKERVLIYIELKKENSQQPLIPTSCPVYYHYLCGGLCMNCTVTRVFTWLRTVGTPLRKDPFVFPVIVRL